MTAQQVTTLQQQQQLVGNPDLGAQLEYQQYMQPIQHAYNLPWLNQNGYNVQFGQFLQPNHTQRQFDQSFQLQHPQYNHMQSQQMTVHQGPSGIEIPNTNVTPTNTSIPQYQYYRSSAGPRRHYGSVSRVKSGRRSYAVQQLQVLNNSYELNNYPDVEERRRLSAMVGLSKTQVTIWFANKRSAEKKKARKRQKITRMQTQTKLPSPEEAKSIMDSQQWQGIVISDIATQESSSTEEAEPSNGSQHWSGIVVSDGVTREVPVQHQYHHFDPTASQWTQQQHYHPSLGYMHNPYSSVPPMDYHSIPANMVQHMHLNMQQATMQYDMSSNM